MQRIAVVFVVLLAHACSFALVSGPPPNHRELPSFSCTTSRLGPILDAVWTALQVANFFTALHDTDQQWTDTFPNHNPPFSRHTALPVYTVLAALGGAGMYYGFSRTGQCREAQAELAGRRGQGPGVGTWPPPAPSPPPSPSPTPSPSPSPSPSPPPPPPPPQPSPVP
jgi:hypothetical protein